MERPYCLSVNLLPSDIWVLRREAGDLQLARSLSLNFSTSDSDPAPPLPCMHAIASAESRSDSSIPTLRFARPAGPGSEELRLPTQARCSLRAPHALASGVCNDRMDIDGGPTVHTHLQVVQVPYSLPHWGDPGNSERICMRGGGPTHRSEFAYRTTASMESTARLRAHVSTDDHSRFFIAWALRSESMHWPWHLRRRGTILILCFASASF